MYYYSVAEVRKMFERENIKWDGKVYDKSKIKFRPIREDDLTQPSLLIRLHPRSVAPNDSVLTINNFCFKIEGMDFNRDFTNEWCLVLMNKNKEQYAKEVLNYWCKRKSEIIKTYEERKKKGKSLYRFEILEYRISKELIEKAKKYLDKEKA